jgi:CRP-like cAMP-binding protein
MAISHRHSSTRTLPSGELADAVVPLVEDEQKSCPLARNAIFCDLQPPEIERIARKTRKIVAPKGTIVYTPGETAEALFFLDVGKVELYRMTPRGRKLVIDMLGPRACFGEMACIGQSMYDCFAEVTQDAVIYSLSQPRVVALILDWPTVALHLIEAVNRRSVELATRLEEATFKAVHQRVASLLLRLATPGNGRRVVRGYSHQDLAEMLGTYRETVTNALLLLKSRQLIAVAPKCVVLIRPELLQDLAVGTESAAQAHPSRADK